MRIIRYKENLLDECAEFWWSIYKDMTYVHRPDGHQIINTPPIGPDPEYFIKTLRDGFNSAWYWTGDLSPGGGRIEATRKTTDDSVILVEDEGKLAGIIVCSIEEEKRTGDIMSCYVQRNQRGREIADYLLTEALELFHQMGLHRAIAAPGGHRDMEVECPIHLALLDAGFAWEREWWPAYPSELNRIPYEYGVYLGGSLEGFRLQPEIKEKIDKLSKDGIAIERVTAEQFDSLRRIDTGEKVGAFGGAEVAFVALVDELAVGWVEEVGTWTDEYARVNVGGAVPYVIPTYRRGGLGKVLYHLGIEEVVRQGAQYGWTGTNIHNPARLIYRSIGYQYWYTSFGMMSKRLR